MQISYLTDVNSDKRIASIVYPDYSSNPSDALNVTLSNIQDYSFIDVPVEMLSKFLEMASKHTKRRAIGVLLPNILSLAENSQTLEHIHALKRLGINIALIDVVGGVDCRLLEIAKPRFVVLAQTESNFEHLLYDRFFLATCRFFRELGVDVAINTFEQYDSSKMTTVGISYAVHHMTA